MAAQLVCDKRGCKVVVTVSLIVFLDFYRKHGYKLIESGMEIALRANYKVA